MVRPKIGKRHDKREMNIYIGDDIYTPDFSKIHSLAQTGKGSSKELKAYLLQIRDVYLLVSQKVSDKFTFFLDNFTLARETERDNTAYVTV